MNKETELDNLINDLRSRKLSMEKDELGLRREIMEMDFQIKRAKQVFEKNQRMIKKGGISRQEFNKSKDDYELFQNRRKFAIETDRIDSLSRSEQIRQMEGAVKRMEENIKISRTKLENLIIRAPISGNLTSFNAEIGELKSQGQRFGQIDVVDAFKVRAKIDEHYIARINNGLQGECDFTNNTYNLAVTKIYPEVRDGSFEIDMEFNEKSPEDIRRGQTFHVRLALGKLSNVVLLSRGGFYQKTGGRWIFVIDNSETYASKRKIKLGRQNPRYFEVLEGLEGGEKVITSSYDNFGDVDILNLKK